MSDTIAPPRDPVKNDKIIYSFRLLMDPVVKPRDDNSTQAATLTFFKAFVIFSKLPLIE
ncbi:MAG: hypothetical protein PG979_000371 [Rickettsia asembonensis]|nr:MAG: hypothetical protein PG979_000371 [Rickettsia asembonensis]